MKSKYDGLTRYLQELPGDLLMANLSFHELETILGFTLPKSSTDYRQWWANQSDAKNRPQAQAWAEAGFVVEAVHQSEPKWVRFRRKN